MSVGELSGRSAPEPMKTACHDMRFFTLNFVSHLPDVPVRSTPIDPTAPRSR